MYHDILGMLQEVALSNLKEAKEYASSIFPYDLDILNVLKCVLEDDIISARQYAQNFCSSETVFNIPDGFREWMLEGLKSESAEAESSALVSEIIESIPPEVASLLVIEDVKKTFNPRRYWVSKREKTVLDDIISINKSRPLIEKAQIPFLNSTLLYGQSGTGKTQLGRYIAYQLNLPFVWVRFSNLVGASMGETSYNIQLVFDYVQNIQCVLMLDEIDSVCVNRNTNYSGASDEFTRATITLMQCLDLVRRDIVLLAASNKEDGLDPALRRRFTARHELRSFLPDESYEMVVYYLKDVKETGKLDFTWDENDIRSECQIGRTQADLINLCNRAILRAVQTNGKVSLVEENKRTTKKNSWT